MVLTSSFGKWVHPRIRARKEQNAKGKTNVRSPKDREEKSFWGRVLGLMRKATVICDKFDCPVYVIVMRDGKAVVFTPVADSVLPDVAGMDPGQVTYLHLSNFTTVSDTSGTVAPRTQPHDRDSGDKVGTIVAEDSEQVWPTDLHSSGQVYQSFTQLKEPGTVAPADLAWGGTWYSETATPANSIDGILKEGAMLPSDDGAGTMFDVGGAIFDNGMTALEAGIADANDRPQPYVLPHDQYPVLPASDFFDFSLYPDYVPEDDDTGAFGGGDRNSVGSDYPLPDGYCQAV